MTERKDESTAPPRPGAYDSRTETQGHTTAYRLEKRYAPHGAVSQDPDKRAVRGTDGQVSSADYAARARVERGAASAPSPDVPAQPKRYIDLDYHHPLEDVLGQYWMRKLLAYVSRRRSSGRTMIEEILTSYANPQTPRWQRLKYWPFHKFIDRMRGSVSAETFRQRVGEHVSTVRGLVVTARSVAEFGLFVPQRFVAPLFSVWNFTNACNLRCRHCYQDSEHKPLEHELSRAEKFDLVDQMAAEYVPMTAFAGGEPTVSRDLLPVLRRCQKHGIHTTLATHGGTLTPRLTGQLAEAGVKYVEVSLDSVQAAKHDAFRGQPGMWSRTVRGMERVVAQEGMRLGIAMCVHQGNFDEVEDMLQFALDIGASCFAHFNFIPVGRGLEMVDRDLSPSQREQLLGTLNRWMQSGKIGVISTAPQLGRVCLAQAPSAGLQSCSHAGAGGGMKARVVAKYLGGCGAGRTYVCIEPDGNITPCVYLPHRVLGNIRQRRFAAIFRDNEFWDLLCDRAQRVHHCEVCTFKNYCGGCRARADAYFGELNAGDPGCLFNAKHWDELVRRGVVRDPHPACTQQQEETPLGV
ncbi:MAG: radical SAM protein [Planctomycetes bacterium]|nr:radical SAM protein [Planctomycetota bacterium]